MNMNRFAALAALLTFTGLALWSPSISAAYNTADAVDINVTGLIYADPCTVTVPDTLSLGQYARADIAVAGGNTATIPFTIKMTNCPATTTKPRFHLTAYLIPIQIMLLRFMQTARPIRRRI